MHKIFKVVFVIFAICSFIRFFSNRKKTDSLKRAQVCLQNHNSGQKKEIRHRRLLLTPSEMKKERAKDVLILLPGCYWVSLHWGADGRTGSGSAVTCCCCWVVERVVVDVVGLVVVVDAVVVVVEVVGPVVVVVVVDLVVGWDAPDTSVVVVVVVVDVIESSWGCS